MRFLMHELATPGQCWLPSRLWIPQTENKRKGKTICDDMHATLSLLHRWKSKTEKTEAASGIIWKKYACNTILLPPSSINVNVSKEFRKKSFCETFILFQTVATPSYFNGWISIIYIACSASPSSLSLRKYVSTFNFTENMSAPRLNFLWNTFSVSLSVKHLFASQTIATS